MIALMAVPLGWLSYDRGDLRSVTPAGFAEEHAKLAEREEEHLKIVAERIAEYETGNIQMIPFGETIDRIFGKL